jgi:hypothetical protein
MPQFQPLQPETPPPAPPSGGWTRAYALVCALAVVVMAALWWFSAHYNVRMSR